MLEFHAQKNVIILCDSWYVKQNFVSVVDEYDNLDLVGNARADSVLYDLHRKGEWYKEAVFQHHFPHTAPDVLCMAGKCILEQDRERMDAVYSSIHFGGCDIEVSYYE